ncbi:MAG: G8 domain-containing protein, partial [Bacteroidota bacterium]
MPVNAANDSFAAYLSKFLPLSHKLIVSFLLCCCTLWLSAQPEKWSDPASWQSGAVPGVFEKIVIPEGKSILLDISPAPVAELIIEGELIFDEQDINLIVGGIHLKGGLLQIGRKGTPFSHKASLTLIQAPELEGGESKLQKKILISEGGLMRVCGANESPTWTRTKDIISPGDSLLTAVDSLDWPINAEVVLVSTGFSPEETESGTIYNQYGDHMSLASPVVHTHTADYSKKRNRTLDQRAEIGLLSHNVIIQGDQGAAYNQKGPIIRVKDKGRIQVEGAEFRFLGNKENMDGMAICFEEEQADTISFIKNSSLHHFGN